MRADGSDVARDLELRHAGQVDAVAGVEHAGDQHLRVTDIAHQLNLRRDDFDRGHRGPGGESLPDRCIGTDIVDPPGRLHSEGSGVDRNGGELAGDLAIGGIEQADDPVLTTHGDLRAIGREGQRVQAGVHFRLSQHRDIGGDILLEPLLLVAVLGTRDLADDPLDVSWHLTVELS